MLGSLTVLAIFPVGAQNSGQESPDVAQEAVEAASDAQRVRRIREVIEFDRAGEGDASRIASITWKQGEATVLAEKGSVPFILLQSDARG